MSIIGVYNKDRGAQVILPKTGTRVILQILVSYYEALRKMIQL